MKKKAPGFSQCMKLMRSSDPQKQEDGFHFLLPNAKEHLNKLIEEFHLEKDIGLKCWLLELICASKSQKVLEILKSNINHENELLKSRAIYELKRFGYSSEK